MIFYDRNGRPTAFCDDDTHIFLFSGEPVAYIYGNTVYNFKGKQLGWFDSGWVRDLRGACAFSWEKETSVGPVKHAKGVTPVKGVKRVIPIKHTREIKKVRAVNLLSWSPLSGVEFFRQ